MKEEEWGELSQRIEEAFVCPHCGGQGWYVVANSHTGEPEQEQCKWCDDKAGILAALSSLSARLDKKTEEVDALRAEALEARGKA
jgi:transcription elongation factor Elf1